MLAHVAIRGLIDLPVKASGDLHVEPHRTVEDVALTLGQALDEALGDRAGIVRTRSVYLLMDEALTFVAVDLSGRAYVVTEMTWTGAAVGGLPVTLIPHFCESFAVAARATVHVQILYGRDDHHKAEPLFKAPGPRPGRRRAAG